MRSGAYTPRASKPIDGQPNTKRPKNLRCDGMVNQKSSKHCIEATPMFSLVAVAGLTSKPGPEALEFFQKGKLEVILEGGENSFKPRQF